MKFTQICGLFSEDDIKSYFCNCHQV